MPSTLNMNYSDNFLNYSKCMCDEKCKCKCKRIIHSTAHVAFVYMLEIGLLNLWKKRFGSGFLVLSKIKSGSKKLGFIGSVLILIPTKPTNFIPFCKKYKFFWPCFLVRDSVPQQEMGSVLRYCSDCQKSPDSGIRFDLEVRFKFFIFLYE